MCIAANVEYDINDDSDELYQLLEETDSFINSSNKMIELRFHIIEQLFELYLVMTHHRVINDRGEHFKSLAARIAQSLMAACKHDSDRH